MALNRYRHRGRRLHMNVSDINGSGAGDLCLSGDPGVIGTLPVVVQTDEDSNGEASVDTLGVYKFDVVGKGAVDANTQIDPGDELFWDNTLGRLDAGADSGVYFGRLVGKTSVVSGATQEVEVRVGP